MILDNENTNPKVFEWIELNTKNGNLDVVTGYFTIGAIAFFSEKLNSEIKQYRLILGDIVSTESKVERPLDLLNENISIESGFLLNKLAKEAVEFLEQNNVELKTLEPNFCHAKAYLHRRNSNNPRDHYFITGSSNLTEAGIGLRANNNIELNLVGSGDSPQYTELVNWFDNLWINPKAHSKKTIINEKGQQEKVDFKEYLIQEIKKIFREYSPKEIYYKMLYELFGGELLLDESDPEFNRQIGRLENTIVYNTLFEFQRKGVLSLIKMLQHYNGAILADAVGLGKTWSALAVMKFFQIEGYDVILFCPKKLENNWRRYIKNRYSRFEDDKLDYIIRFHTDLFEYRMDKDGITLKDYFQSDRPKLLVIDESHNLRNSKSQRYQFLVENILRKNDKIKVLMLSATPINNTLIDIRNQFKLMVKDNTDGFYETLGIKNIDYTFRAATKAFNDWRESETPVIAEFIKSLPPNFFKLTDALVVARTRKMIEGMQSGLEFPEKGVPDNLFVTPKQIGNFESFEELFEHFPPMLSGYQPSFYADKGIEKSVLDDEKQREHFLVKMMYILLVKRLESSWYSFKSTVEKIRDHHDNALKKIKEYEKTKKVYEAENPELSIFDDDDMQAILDDLSLGKRTTVRLSDIDQNGKLNDYKKDLKKDLDCLDNLKSNLERFEEAIEKETKKSRNHKSLDDKLEVLIKKIKEKRASGKNDRNPKVLIFTVYKDTAFYLYDQLTARGFDKIAVISGDEAKSDDFSESTKLFEPLLERFAPFTKLFKERDWKSFEPSTEELTDQEKYEEWIEFIKEHDTVVHDKVENPVDILIATDVLSEGQNLQDCDYVVNYDIHWNPVRVIQRMGRIDRLGSPNQTIYGINFWPTDNINAYLDLQKRIENRMAQMKLAGSEVDVNFSETFKQMAEDETLEQKQKDKMLRQMETSWKDIEVSDQSLGFNNLSLEDFRQDLFEQIKHDPIYKTMPNGVYTGFEAGENTCPSGGLIALLGYPSHKIGAIKDFKYQTYDLIFVDDNGEGVFLNQKEILDFLSHHKDLERSIPAAIDDGDSAALQLLSQSIRNWIRKQANEIEKQDDGSEKVKMGKSAKDILHKIKHGDKEGFDRIKQNKMDKEMYSSDNFDLIAWFNIIK